MPLDDIMSMWYSHDEHIPGEFEPAGPGIGLMDSSDPDDDETASEGNRLPTARVDEEDATPVDDEELARRLPKLGAYRESILAAPAYRWLISDIERQLRLSSSSPSGSETIQREIFQAFPQVRHLSRSSPPRRSKIMYKMPWDPIAFCKDQEYSEEAPDALAWAITLTGSTSVAQALTSSQYLRQTWPSSGQDILELIQELLRGTPGIRVGKSLSDGTVVTAWFDTSNDSEQPHFTAEATGTAYTLAEIGEQLAWLGAALQSSPYPDGVTSMQAGIKTLWVIHDNSKFPGDGFLSEVLCGLEFKVCAPESNARTSGPNSNGECWHSLFRNPVLVRGFPIARRASELGSATGLEIPIHMMARLARSRVLNSFCGRTVLKGFSTLLVPTRRLDGVIVWHLIHDEYGDRVSYLECLQEPHIHQIPVREIQKARHILGWCSKARFLAGTASANYDVTSSRLPRARSGSLLQQASISGGQAISGGEPFSVGYKDSPPHISRMGYIRKLKWISRKFVVLWDEGTKRGWLLNGTTALLHLVRASLEHDSKDKFSSQFLFRVGDMEEAPPNATYESDSAIRVLLSDLNRKLRIYPEKDGYIQFEDRVEHIYGLLAQTIDHQAHALSSYNAQSSNVSRAHLEGWDFHDLASDMDPVHPRTFPLGTLGMAWIELARSIHAVTLVGRGFGDIMTPAKPSCTQWATLPMGKYYLAVSASDLMDIMDAVGDASTIPPRLTDNLLWLNTATMTPDGCCQGGGQCTEDHVDVVQVLLPPDINHASKKRYTCPPEDGAVVFGHNENVPWFWKETGHPVYGSPDRLDRPVLHSSSESGYGPSTEGESGSTRPTSPPSSVQGDMPAPAVALRVPLPATKVKLGRHALSINSYTVGIVCALPLELFAVRALFDVTHADKDGIVTPSDDSNHYALGEIGKHKVVAACLPDGQYGTNSAADVITNMKRTFTSVKFALLVGIGGGVPSSANDIRLGDVVVSRPTGTSPGVIQYDMGKVVEDGGFTQTGYLQPPPRFIMTALSNLRSDPHLSSTPLQESLEEISACSREYRYPGKGPDRLFTSDYPHDLALATCNSCDTRRLQPRRIRHDSKTNTHNPRIHYGTIASGNRVVRDAKFRDHWSKEANILCFEMEAAGIMNTLPCLVIRGICDYSDSHKNKVFQNYAAAAAASYAKLLLSYVKNATDPDGIVEGEIVEKRKHFKGLRRAFRGDLPFFSRS
ncbi:hypothetical protein BJY00DRAFT_324414 [Aspergillus carlsbadensis]|nr:hypothetical protein BJY00DRAFT_324414 [Aspergillus carlsbadensis]